MMKTKQEIMFDWNKLSLEQSVKILRDEFKYDSSGLAKCVLNLIEFYDKKNEYAKHENKNLLHWLKTTYPVQNVGEVGLTIDEIIDKYNKFKNEQG